MTVITDQDDLNQLCKALSAQPYVAVDTEFLRDRTYYPQLCLVQIAPPLEIEGGDPVAIDPLAGLDLAPLLDLMGNESVVKVFHAARQDLEIFFNLTGKVPHPIFDTQVAAMVNGYGDQVGYHTLVADICDEKLDKGAQFTDWARRPLSDKQLSYALDDVHYLRKIYVHLKRMLEQRGRGAWVEQEMKILTSAGTYQNPPEDAWQRIKIKTDKPQVIAVLKQLAAWRESEAQRRNIPRNRVLRDEVLADMAVHPPKNVDELKRVRGLGEDVAKSKHGAAILEAVKRGLDAPRVKGPAVERRERLPSELQPVLEMLKMLLRIVASEQGVAGRLIASSDDLEELAKRDDAAIPAMEGWRYEVFGREALNMKHGKTALSLDKGVIVKKPV
jgi:ribonuclease D